MTTVTCANKIETGLGSPVIDMTGLQGTYHLRLVFNQDYCVQATPPLGTAPPSDDSLSDKCKSMPSIFQALSALGLEAQVKKVPVNFFVIQHLETPAPNL